MPPKIIVLEPNELQEGTSVGAVQVLTLALGYYVMRPGRQEEGDCDLESKE